VPNNIYNKIFTLITLLFYCLYLFRNSITYLTNVYAYTMNNNITKKQRFKEKLITIIDNNITIIDLYFFFNFKMNYKRIRTWFYAHKQTDSWSSDRCYPSNTHAHTRPIYPLRHTQSYRFSLSRQLFFLSLAPFS
jgi:hypothetical protein